ncbi:N-6 DNA methylase [Lentzea sp. NPDC060358]|uniref:N-6 DNA methylase n=1 Tax=Lentzea sp. NPDC060358 TaxID=3347103 RepID=UPI00364D51B7
MAVASGSSAFAEHRVWLDELLRGILQGHPIGAELIDLGLDGHSAAEARRLLPLDFRRSVGAFFTPSTLRAEVSAILRDIPGRRYLDPTCGAGDLLLAAADHLPIKRTLRETIANWNSHLAGWDLHKEFIQTTQRRIVLHAAKRHLLATGSARWKNSDYDGFLTQIQVGNASENLHDTGGKHDVVLLNPPYVRVPVQRPDISWAGGSTSSAAIFLLDAVDYLDNGAHIVAILPDSLRSGTNFSKWRAAVEAKSDVKLVRNSGQFDQHTDIDVFLLVLQVRSHGPSNKDVEWWPKVDHSVTVSDRFDVRVGTVVDNRDPLEGKNYPFLVARDLPTSGTSTAPKRRRRFSGRVFTPPFVVIRRTSRPAGKNTVARSNGVLITGKSAIAIDNHLIVATPRSGTVEECKQLLRVLDSPSTTSSLDDRIRCRHLTVGTVRELPWIEDQT